MESAIDLATLADSAKLFNFDAENPIATDAANFRDPSHPKKQGTKDVAKENRERIEPWT